MGRIEGVVCVRRALSSNLRQRLAESGCHLGGKDGTRGQHG